MENIAETIYCNINGAFVYKFPWNGSPIHVRELMPKNTINKIDVVLWKKMMIELKIKIMRQIPTNI